MKYGTISDLPASVKDHLPMHAQEIYKSTFNSAFEKYKAKNKQKTANTQEAVAHKVAWAAVKRKYKKQDNKWVEKE